MSSLYSEGALRACASSLRDLLKRRLSMPARLAIRDRAWSAVAFVLHDIFAVPFDAVAMIVDRSPEAARQLASRARRPVQAAPATGALDLARKRELIDAFLAASRAGDFDALLALLDPDVIFRTDETAVRFGAPTESHGVDAAARAAAGRAWGAEPGQADSVRSIRLRACAFSRERGELSFWDRRAFSRF